MLRAHLSQISYDGQCLAEVRSGDRVRAGGKYADRHAPLADIQLVHVELGADDTVFP